MSLNTRVVSRFQYAFKTVKVCLIVFSETLWINIYNVFLNGPALASPTNLLNF